MDWVVGGPCLSRPCRLVSGAAGGHPVLQVAKHGMPIAGARGRCGAVVAGAAREWSLMGIGV